MGSFPEEVVTMVHSWSYEIIPDFIAVDVGSALYLTRCDVADELARQLKWCISDRTYSEQVARFLKYVYFWQLNKLAVLLAWIFGECAQVIASNTEDMAVRIQECAMKYNSIIISYLFNSVKVGVHILD